MKNIIAIVVCIIIGAVGAELYNKGKLAGAVAEVEALQAMVIEREVEYEDLRLRSEEELATLRGMVDSAATIIWEYEEVIVLLEGQAAEQDAEINALLTAEVQELIERYPALKSYTLALRQQIDNKGKIIFSLEARDVERVKIIEAQGRQIQLEREIGLSWKKQFEDQRSLRIAEESVFQRYRRSSSLSRLLWTVGAGAAGFVGGVLSN